MQHRVGRAAGRHHQRDCVFDRVARDDIARLQVALDGVDQSASGRCGRIGFFGIRRGHLRASQQTHAQRLERRRHRVRRVLTTAGADTGTGVLLDALEILLGHLAGAIRADRLERADDRELLALPVARLDRSGIDEDPGHVDARHRHHRAGHVLVAAADADDAVHALTVDRDFDRVGNHFA